MDYVSINIYYTIIQAHRNMLITKIKQKVLISKYKFDQSA